jgi:hypothetical protein
MMQKMHEWLFGRPAPPPRKHPTVPLPARPDLDLPTPDQVEIAAEELTRRLHLIDTQLAIYRGEWDA